MVKFVLRALSALVLLVVGTLVFAQVASAATTSGGSTSPSTLQVLLTVNLVVSILAPLLTSLITNSAADERVKTVVNLLITAVVGAVTPFLTGQVSIDDLNWGVLALSIAQVWLSSIIAHYGLWKPAGVTGSGGSISNAVPGGIGKPQPVGEHEANPDVTNGDLVDPSKDANAADSPYDGLPEDTVEDPEYKP